METANTIAKFNDSGQPVDSKMVEHDRGLILGYGQLVRLFTNSETIDTNSWVQILNAPDQADAARLAAGGMLVADDYNYYNVPKNDMFVKGRVVVGSYIEIAPSQGTPARPSGNPGLWLSSGYVGIDSVTPAPNVVVEMGEDVDHGGGIYVRNSQTGYSVTVGEDDAAAGQIRLFGPLNQNSANQYVSIGLGRDPQGGSGSIVVNDQMQRVIVSIGSQPGLPSMGAVAVLDATTQGGPTIKAAMYVDANGQGILQAEALEVSGAKMFRTPSPTQSDKDIVYACLEGPEAAVFARGTAQLVNGEASISLPGHFIDVASPDHIMVHLTPLSAASLGLAVVGKKLAGIEIKELHNGTGSYAFDWEVKSVRRNYENYQAVRPRRGEQPMPRDLKPISQIIPRPVR
jgi:hypothetical protein